MSPQRVHMALETWRTAERVRDELREDDDGYTAAVRAVTDAREAYLDAVRVVAESMGSTGMADVPAAISHLWAAEARRRDPALTAGPHDAAAQAVVETARDIAAQVTMEETHTED